MDLAPSTVDEWCRWAEVEYRYGRRDRGLFGYRKAIAIAPQALFPHLALAARLLDDGELPAAAVLVEQAQRIAPNRPEVLWLDARIAIASGHPRKAREALDRMLIDTRLNDEQWAEAQLTLGFVLEDIGETVAAFAATTSGKQRQRALFAAMANDREGEISKLHRVTRWLNETPIEWGRFSQPTAANAAASHVFLIGFPRSGTTLLEQVLAAHPDVETLEEEPTLAPAYQAFLSDDAACSAFLNLSNEEAGAWAEHYWQRIRERGFDVSGKLFVDKQPAGTLYLPLIARLFPSAKILFALRDPRDVVLSCFRQAFRMNAMTYAFTDLSETAACYDACMAFAEAARPRLYLAWADVRHEALVEDFEAELARIVAFLDLAPHSAMADFAQTARSRPIRTPSAPQVRAGLNRRGLGRWRQFESELAPVLPLLTPWIERFGYAL